MKKTWNRVIIISLVVLMLEAIAAVILLTPSYKMFKVFKNIDTGRWSDAQEAFADLTDEQRSQVLSYMDNYARELCREYIAEERSYIHTAASFDAINSIDTSGSIADTYMPSVNHNEYKKSINELFEANRSFDSNGAFEAKDTINAVQQRLDTDTRERIMVEMLNEKYQSFLDGRMESKDINAFAAIISGMSFYNAHDYAGVIVNNVSCVERYRELYSTAQAEFAANNYFAVIDICSAVSVDLYDTRYMGLFETMHNDAYNTGKNYYKSKLNDYIKKDDSAAAVALMEQIEKHYGDDFDLSDAKAEMAEDWQRKYIDVASNVDTLLLTALNETETGQYILENEYSTLKPDSLMLYDVNADGVPEMFLFNGNNVENNYVGCFMFGYDGENYKYMGFVNVISFCTDSNIIAFPIAFDRVAGEEYSLVEYDGAAIYEVSYCQIIDGKYYVNGEETNDADYLSAQSLILAHANEKTIKAAGYADISDCESYIISY